MNKKKFVAHTLLFAFSFGQVYLPLTAGVCVADGKLFAAVVCIAACVISNLQVFRCLDNPDHWLTRMFD